MKRPGRAGNNHHRTGLGMCTVPENSAVGTSASNAGAEQIVRIVEDQLRTLKAALEARIGTEFQRPPNCSLACQAQRCIAWHEMT